jgi:hypothetical protein
VSTNVLSKSHLTREGGDKMISNDMINKYDNVKDRGATGRGVNGSRVKFFVRISLCPKFKTPDNIDESTF